MKLISQSEDQVEVRLNLSELVLLRNVLNEVCNGMHFTDNDLAAIFDMSRADAQELLLHFNSALERLDLLPE